MSNNIILECIQAHKNLILELQYLRIRPSLTASKYFWPENPPELSAPNATKMRFVLTKAETGIQDDSRYFWKLLNSFESSYPELVYDMCQWLLKRGYYSPEIGLIDQSWRIAFILLSIGLRKYIKNFENHQLYYLEDLINFNNSDSKYVEMISNRADRFKFFEAIDKKNKILRSFLKSSGIKSTTNSYATHICTARTAVPANSVSKPINIPRSCVNATCSVSATLKAWYSCPDFPNPVKFVSSGNRG